jgi:hypothetical protein
VSTVISLCDLTGHMVQPWVEAGHTAILVDPQHGVSHWDGDVHKFAGTVEDALPYLGKVIARRDVAAVFAFPPCTDMAVSGARWFEAKRAFRSATPLGFARAVFAANGARRVAA